MPSLSSVISDMLQTGKNPDAVYRDCAAKLLQNIQLEAIRQERKRQDAKWGEQNHSPEKWVSILGEEFGELCQAVNETMFDNGPDERAKGGYENMRREAIQVAAVAVGFLECLDRQVMQQRTDAPKVEANRVLTREEVLALPEGALAFIEDITDHECDGFCKRTNGGMMDSSGFTWRAWIDTPYVDYRFWSHGAPSPAESAAVPWKKAPEC